MPVWGFRAHNGTEAFYSCPCSHRHWSRYASSFRIKQCCYCRSLVSGIDTWIIHSASSYFTQIVTSNLRHLAVISWEQVLCQALGKAGSIRVWSLTFLGSLMRVRAVSEVTQLFCGKAERCWGLTCCKPILFTFLLHCSLSTGFLGAASFSSYSHEAHFLK